MIFFDPNIDDFPSPDIDFQQEFNFLPEGCYAELLEDDFDTSKMTMVYNDVGDLAFILLQSTVFEEVLISNNEYVVTTNCYVENYEAVLTSYQDQPGFYVLIWSDGLYQYYLFGYDTISKIMIQVAKEIKLP